MHCLNCIILDAIAFALWTYSLGKHISNLSLPINYILKQSSSHHYKKWLVSKYFAFLATKRTQQSIKYYGAKIWNLKPLIQKVFKRERRNSFELLVLIFLCLYFQIIQAFLFQFIKWQLE